MKKIYFGLLVFTSVIFTACEKDNETNISDIDVEDKTQLIQSVFADNLKGKNDVRFTTKTAWTSSIKEVNENKSQTQKNSVTITPNWVSISPDSGMEAGDYVISINLTENLTKFDRTATITIFCGETQVTITITQKAIKEDGTLPEEKRGGIGKFILSDYYSQKVLGQVEVDEAKLDEYNKITFYNSGTPIDIYLSMSNMTANTYYWCEYNCTSNYFYTQKGVTEGIMWYARKGAVELSEQNDIYTISLFLDTDKDYYGNNVRIAINGTYTGYLVTKQ